MQAGKLNKWVTLSRSPISSPDNDGFFEPLTPEGAWAGIQPLSPGADGRTTTSLITIRYHAQVNVDTRLVYGSREFFVRGVQNLDERNDEMRLLCEEIAP